MRRKDSQNNTSPNSHKTDLRCCSWNRRSEAASMLLCMSTHSRATRAIMPPLPLLLLLQPPPSTAAAADDDDAVGAASTSPAAPSSTRIPTPSRASGGQGSNHTVVMQLTSEGNCRQRVRNALPTGLVAKVMCMWWRARWMNASQAAARPGRSSSEGCVASQGRSWSSRRACSSGVKRPDEVPRAAQQLVVKRGRCHRVSNCLRKQQVGFNCTGAPVIIQLPSESQPSEQSPCTCDLSGVEQSVDVSQHRLVCDVVVGQQQHNVASLHTSHLGVCTNGRCSNTWVHCH